MTNFIKIIRVGTQGEYNRQGNLAQGDVFCKISFEDSKLSITGVIAPLSNGDANGSCGQIYDSINIDVFNEGWNKTKLAKFIAIWKEWHLNDMNAYSLDMKAQGWDKLASNEIFKYSFSMTSDARKWLADIKERCQYAALNNEIATLPDVEKRLLQSETYKDVYGYEQPEAPEFMELSTDYSSKRPKIERKTLGWVNCNEHKDGLLGKELNGERYGHKWFKHDVPCEVLAFLKGLPDTDKKPAWV